MRVLKTLLTIVLVMILTDASAKIEISYGKYAVGYDTNVYKDVSVKIVYVEYDRSTNIALGEKIVERKIGNSGYISLSETGCGECTKYKVPVILIVEEGTENETYAYLKNLQKVIIAPKERELMPRDFVEVSWH